MSPPTPAVFDAEMIRRVLRVLVQSESVVELRVPRTRQGTVSGYFNDLHALISCTVKMSGKAEGVYVTLNPLRRDLIARASNRLVPFAKHTSCDRDVIRLCWFLIDFDPIRPAGISSTDAEHASALERANQCREWLRADGWPDPIFADSGNGGHLVYCVDLANNNPGADLLRSCLAALAFQFSDSAVEVDLATYNPARLVKVYGTLAAKGDNVAERPHRLARLLHVPDGRVPVAVDLLEKLARRIPRAGCQRGGGQRLAKGNRFDLQQWIDEHSLEVDGPTPWKDGRKWILNVCPWNPLHRRSAYVVQFSAGAIAAGCHHQSCVNKWWHDLRDSVEPGWRARRNHWASEVVGEELIPPREEPAAVFPVDALPSPIARYVREASASLGCPPDLVGIPALAAAGAAIGTSRVLEVKRGWKERPVIFSAVVSDPGTLKSPALDKALKPTYRFQDRLQEEYEAAVSTYKNHLADYQARLACWQVRVKRSRASDRAGAAEDGAPSEKCDGALEAPPEKPEEPIMAQVFTTDSTVEALADLLRHNPHGLLFARDEVIGWARAMNQYRNGKGADRQGWLSFWNGSPVIVNRKGREAILLPDPFVCVTGGLPPDVLDDLPDERGREDGFVHRILFSFPDRVNPTWSDLTISTEAMDGYTLVFENLHALTLDDGTEGGAPRPRVVTFTAQGRVNFVEWARGHFREMADNCFPEHLRGPWAKMAGYCARLVLILHECRYVSNDAATEDPDPESVRRAIVFINYFKNHARRVYARLRFTPEDKRIADAVAWIRRQGGSTSLRNLVTYRVAGSRNREEGEVLLHNLEDRGYGKIGKSTPPGGGRETIDFRLKEESQLTV